MDVVRLSPVPAIKLPPPNFVMTESPPMSPLAKNKNQFMKRTTNTTSLQSDKISTNTRTSHLTSPGSPSMKPKLTLTSPGTTLGVSKPGVMRRSLSEPAKSTNRRVNLGPGCGMLDWIRLCKNTKDMSGTGGEVLTVTEDELARHCTSEDAWTAIRGKVYNITPYFKFHPGGKGDLLKAAGKDCTILFDEVHKWVNYASMLKKCFIGNMSEDTKRNRAGSLNVPRQLMVPDGLNRQAVSKRTSESNDEALVHSPQSPVHPPIQFIDETDSPAIVVDPPSPIRKNSDASRPVVTLWDWNQNADCINIQVFIHNQNITDSDIIVDSDGHSFVASIKLDSWIYQMEIELHKPVKNPKVYIHSNKVDIRLTKLQLNDLWETIGILLPAHNQMVSETNRVMKFRSCTIRSVQDVTHDSKLFTIDIPPSCSMSVPIGHHVSIRPNEPSSDLERSYTPVAPLSSTPVAPLSSTLVAPLSSASHSSTRNSNNTIELLIKLYKDGAMSQHLAKLAAGDQLRVSDPQGTFDATRLNNVTDVLLLAAGTGFTPMVRVLNQLLSSTTITKKNVHLIFANKTRKDIIWQEEIDQLAKSNESFKISHILSSPDDSWQGLSGRVSSELLKTNLPKLQDQKNNVLVCVCGPLPFTAAMTDILLDTDYPEHCIHIFQ